MEPNDNNGQEQAAVTTEVDATGHIRTEVVAVVTKGDLNETKNDLRREMKLWLGVGSTLGTALSGFLGAYAAKPTQTMETVAAVFDALTF